MKDKREIWIGTASALLWTLLIGFAAISLVQFGRARIDDLALEKARAVYQAVVDFRRWNAEHGGVYVPVTDKTQPNPHLPSRYRELMTSEGVILTLVNPAFMTRQTADLSEREHHLQVRLTSLKPLRPENAPAPWEREILETFEKGHSETSEFSTDAELGPVFRFMAPLVTEAPCLECHASQGYQVGDVRGAISISYPAAPFVAAKADFTRNTVIGASVLWLVGIALIVALATIFRGNRRDLWRFRDLSLIDDLTGLSNRRGFWALAEQALRSMARRGQQAIIAFVDVDCFKEINDEHGHEEGDAALRRLSLLLQSTFRDSDIIGRFGGDEFVLLFQDSPPDGCDAVRRRLGAALDLENNSHRSYELSVSVGLIPFDPKTQADLTSLITEADSAMYAEKARRPVDCTRLRS